MKIGHVVKHFNPCIGGVENYCENLATHLQQKGYYNKIITLNTCYKSKIKLKPKDKFVNIPIYRIKYLNFKYIYKIAPSVLKHIKDVDLIIIHGHDFFVDFLSLTKWIHKKKIILITHGGIFHTHRNNIFKKMYFYIWSRLIMLFVDKVIACSEVDYNRYIAITKKIVLFENPIVINTEKQVPKIKNQFIYVGRISENKRIENLIKTFSYLKDIKFNLIILGPDNDNKIPELTNLARNYNIENKILFTGSVSENSKNQYVKESEFFVSASEYEGFGLSLIEGMSGYTIPIVQPNDSFKKLISDGENGFLIDYTNPKFAADKILNIINKNKKEHLAEKCRQYSLNFSWDNKIKEFTKILKSVIK